MGKAKFKVGDMVKGISDKYAWTNEDMTAAEIVDVNNDFDYITAKITEHLTDGSVVGKEFPGLCPEDFERIPKFKSGDKVKSKFDGEIHTLEGRRLTADRIGYGPAWNLKGRDTWLGEDQIELVEEEPEKPEQPKFSVGDTVTVVAEGSHFLAVGENAKITSVWGGGKYDAEGRRRGESRIVSQIVRDSDLEPAETPYKFDAGDRVHVENQFYQGEGTVVERHKGVLGTPGYLIDTDDNHRGQRDDGLLYTTYHGVSEGSPKPTHIRMLDEWDPGYELGDILELTGDGDLFIDKDGDLRPLSAHEFEYVDGEAKTEAQERPKVGDKVRVIARHEDRSSTRHNFEIGTIVEVRSDDGGDDIPLSCRSDGSVWWLDLDEVEPVNYEITRDDVVSYLLDRTDSELVEIIAEVLN